MDHEIGYISKAQEGAAQAVALSLSLSAKCNLTAFCGRTGNTKTATRLHEIEIAYPSNQAIQRLVIPALKATLWPRCITSFTADGNSYSPRGESETSRHGAKISGPKRQQFMLTSFG